MASHNDLGKLGEQMAVDLLINKGYIILETNWVFDKAEIDVIAQQGNTLAVVEVKTRSSLSFGLPQEFVKPKKIQLLVKAINEFVHREGLNVDVRFDIIAIHKEVSGFTIEHIEDAFHYF
jgi:putative endonuclease